MKKRIRIIWKVYLSYLIVILISLLAVSWYTLTSMQQFFLESTEADLETQGKLLIEQVKDLLSPSDKISVDKICKTVGRSIDTRITIIMASGKVIGDSEENPKNMDDHQNRPEMANALKGNRGTSIRYSGTLQKRMMYVAIPVYQNNKIVAIVRTSIGLTAVDDEMKTVRMKIMFGGLFIAILASLVCLIVSRQISKPIEEMKQVAEKFANGDFEHRLIPPTTFELAGLADTMNEMANQLKKRIETVINQRNEYEAVLSSMVEGVLAIDKDAQIISINKAAKEILEIKYSGSQERNIHELIRNLEFQRLVEESLENDVSNNKDIVIRSNEDRIVNTVCSPLYNAEKQLIGTLIVLNDVTQLRQLEHMRRDFAASVSHELKTPLTAIKGFVETLQDGAIESIDDARRFLDIIDKHVNRLNDIITDLLALSRIEQRDEKQSYAFSEIKLSYVIESSISFCQEKADEAGVSLEHHDAPDITVKGDSSLLEQAFINLMDNAIKYSKQGDAVQVKSLKKQDVATIQFKDTGVGIEKKHLPRLFERFYRVDKARNRKLGGTGLGLAIVKHIVNAHNGSITVDSTLGKGSMFEIQLPLGSK